ncbi:MAG TPA: hypothetical protein V6D06_16005, partial [Trichocoleus sp.]
CCYSVAIGSGDAGQPGLSVEQLPAHKESLLELFQHLSYILLLKTPQLDGVAIDFGGFDLEAVEQARNFFVEGNALFGSRKPQ